MGKQNEAFFINEDYYEDILQYAEQVGEIEDLPDDWSVEATCCEYQPIQVFSADWIAQMINEERFSEDQSETEYVKIINALNECVDFEKLNSLTPRLNYSTRQRYLICKQDLIDAVG